MDALAAFVLFLATAAVVAIVSLKLWVRPQAALARITEQRQDNTAGSPHPLTSLRQMIEKIGAAMPAKPKDSRVIERQLMRAGFRQPDAMKLYTGWRISLAVVLPLVALALVAGAKIGADRKLLAVGAAAVAGYMAPARYLIIRTRRRQRRLERSLPDALDLLVVCVESGLGLDQAILQAAKELETSRPEISQEFAMANYEMRGGKRRMDALRDMVTRAGVDGLGKLVTVLIQADKFGTSIGQTLRAQSDYMRLRARQAAEEKAAKLGVKLVFPIFFCILPSLFVVTVGPVVVKVYRELRPMLDTM